MLHLERKLAAPMDACARRPGTPVPQGLRACPDERERVRGRVIGPARSRERDQLVVRCALERGRIRQTGHVLSPQAHACVPGREGVRPHPRPGARGPPRAAPPCPAGGRGATPRLRGTRRRRCGAYRAPRTSRARQRGSCGEEKRRAAARAGGRTTPSPVSPPHSCPTQGAERARLPRCPPPMVCLCASH